MERATGKQIRLTDYDYSLPGACFVTVCTRDKRCILSGIELPDPDERQFPYDRPKAGLSVVVGQMKRWASKKAGIGLRQRSFHEHVIRGKQDWEEIWKYIDQNPARWSEDVYHS